MAIAHTTQISKHLSQPTSGIFFGQPTPKGVLTLQLFHDPSTDTLSVRWRVRNDPVIHEMPYEHSDEGVMAVLAAMKLTC